MKIIDTHAHLTCDALYPDVEGILKRAKENDLEAIVNICTDETTLERGLFLKEKYPWIYNVAATTPHDVETQGESFFPKVEQFARQGALVAIGETGLDYYYEHSEKKVQKQYLLRYFALALSCQLPLVFHCRDAFKDLFDLADSHYLDTPAVLHCFTGDVNEAKGVLDRGWYLSLSGIVTFKKSERLKEVAKYVPIDRLFVETDAPYLAPQKQRSKTNEPSFIKETIECIANLKGLSLEEVASHTRENARRFFSTSGGL